MIWVERKIIMKPETFRADRSGGMGGGNPSYEKYEPPKGWVPRRIQSGGGFLLSITPLPQAKETTDPHHKIHLRPNARQKLKNTQK